MTFQQKIDDSIIIRTGKIYYKHMNFLTASQRLRSLFMFFMLALYTVFTKIILKNYEFDILVLANIVSLISMLFIKITTRTIFALNHYKLFSFIVFINKVARLVIFIYAAILYYNALTVALYELYDMELFELVYILFTKTYLAGEYFRELFFAMPIEVISFCFTVIVFIPSFFYFFALNLKIIMSVLVWFIPIVNIILLFNWLFRGTYIFYEYKKEDENFYTINTRKITNKFYILNKFLLKLVFLIIIGVVIYICFRFL